MYVLWYKAMMVYVIAEATLEPICLFVLCGIYLNGVFRTWTVTFSTIDTDGCIDTLVLIINLHQYEHNIKMMNTKYTKPKWDSVAYGLPAV